jgi:hypothetical protein
MAILDNGFNYTHIAANGTSAIRTGPCVLHAVSVNKAGASSNTATVYDNATGGTSNTVAIIDTTRSGLGYIQYDVTLLNGLQVVVATGTAADLTICWSPLTA